MIAGHVTDSSGQYVRHEADAGASTLRVEAPTSGKEQLMVYVTLDSPSGAGRAKLSFEMSDPRIDGGQPFRMSRLDGTFVAPMVIELAQPGRYRVPIPTGANEQRLFVKAKLVGGDPATDALAFWVATSAYQPVSGLLT